MNACESCVSFRNYCIDLQTSRKDRKIKTRILTYVPCMCVTLPPWSAKIINRNAIVLPLRRRVMYLAGNTVQYSHTAHNFLFLLQLQAKTQHNVFAKNAPTTSNTQHFILHRKRQTPTPLSKNAQLYSTVLELSSKIQSRPGLYCNSLSNCVRIAVTCSMFPKSRQRPVGRL